MSLCSLALFVLSLLIIFIISDGVVGQKYIEEGQGDLRYVWQSSSFDPDELITNNNLPMLTKW